MPDIPSQGCGESLRCLKFNCGFRSVRSGRGLSFWFRTQRASIAELPMDDRNMLLFFKGRSRDFQAVSVQGNLTWHVVQAVTLGQRVDFSINLTTGRHIGKPVEQIEHVNVTPDLLATQLGEFQRAGRVG